MALFMEEFYTGADPYHRGILGASKFFREFCQKAEFKQLAALVAS
jgi:hypothetical protein